MPTVRADELAGHMAPTGGRPTAEVTDPLDVRARLDELKQLRHGWLNGKGLPLNAPALDRLASLFETYYPANLPRPYVYPTAEGGVRFEWSPRGQEVSLDIVLDTMRASWHALDLATDAETENGLSLDVPESWHWLAGELRRLSGAAA